MLTDLIALIRIGFIHPTLFLLIVRTKRKKRTYLSYKKLFSLIVNFLTLAKQEKTALLVGEFGVGRGGSATILAWLVDHYGGKLMLFDVFGRIPAPTERDGAQSLSRYEDILHDEDRDYYGNLSGLLSVIQSEIAEVCDLSRIEFIEGRFEDTLPRIQTRKAFHLVHIDCDWYESTRIVLDFLRANLHRPAILQIDDYSTWQGSRIAVDETEWLKPFGFNLVDGALLIKLQSPMAGC